MCTDQSKKIWLNVISVSLVLGVSAALLLSCGAAVDIGETSKYLDRFEIEWPDGFINSCINGISVPITVNAIDQNGQVYTNWSGKDITLEKQYGDDITVSPEFFDMESGTKHVDIKFTLDEEWTNNKTIVRVTYQDKPSPWSSEITVQDIFGAGGYPPDKSLLVGHQTIIVTFNDAVKDGEFSFTGIGDVKEVWETDRKMVTLTPNTFWTEGDGKSVILSCEAESDGQTFSDSLTYDVFHGVCVSGSSGWSGNIGSTDLPLDTVQHGIDYAVTKGYTYATVRVAGGTYISNYDTTSTPVVAMKNGISLWGGFSEDFLTHNPATFTTTIKDDSAAGGSLGDPTRAVECGSGFTRATELSYCTIVVGAGDFSAAVFCSGTESNLTISENKVVGSSSSSGAGEIVVGIYNKNAAVVIENDQIDPGWNSNTGASTSYGIYNDSSSCTIQQSTIKGGKGGFETYGIFCFAPSSPTIKADIDCGSEGSTSYGIFILNATPYISYCTFTNVAESGAVYFMFELFTSPLLFEYNHFGWSGGVWYHDHELSNDVTQFDWSSKKVTVGGDEQYLSFWNNTGEGV